LGNTRSNRDCRAQGEQQKFLHHGFRIPHSRKRRPESLSFYQLREEKRNGSSVPGKAVCLQPANGQGIAAFITEEKRS
jgi:hypothetical protein